MARLIDADALHFEACKRLELARDRYLDSPTNNPATQRYHTQVTEREDFKTFIENAPTVDAESVVHCKDCSFFTCNSLIKAFECGNLEGMGEIIDPNTDFCSCGEKKEV